MDQRQGSVRSLLAGSLLHLGSQVCAVRSQVLDGKSQYAVSVHLGEQDILRQLSPHLGEALLLEEEEENSLFLLPFKIRFLGALNPWMSPAKWLLKENFLSLALSSGPSCRH